MRLIEFFRYLNKCTINVTTDCWEWTAARTIKGYGRFDVYSNNKVKHLRAHRVSYELFLGEIPPNIMVCHKCDNPSCINPEHLFLGTNADNIGDMMKKNRQLKGEDHGRNKLSLDEVQYIKAYPRYHGSGVKLADQFNVSTTTIYYIRSGKLWKHLT